MGSHIQNLVQNVLGDGARSSKYDVMLQFTNQDPVNSRSGFSRIKHLKIFKIFKTFAKWAKKFLG